MKSYAYFFVNAITGYRVLAAPVIFALAFMHKEEPFKWLLLISFLTDVVDGLLARWLHVTSKFGVMLDSIGDQLTVFAGIAGALAFRTDFFYNNRIAVSIPVGLFLVETILSLIRYRKLSGFHTYLAKAAAVLQGIFLVSIFFMENPSLVLFFAAVIVTSAELTEEIIMVTLLRKWESNSKGLYWVLKRRNLRKV